MGPKILVRSVLAGCFLAAWLLLPALRAGPVQGWRTDGTGVYPEEQPPRVWGLEKNVIWATPLSSWSNATPVLAGGKVFVCAEPASLICINAADGQFLWQRDCEYKDVLPAEEWKVAEENHQRIDGIKVRLRPVEKELRVLQAQLKLSQTPELETKVKALAEQVAAIKKEMEPFSKYELPPTQGSNGYTSATPVTDGAMVYVLNGSGVVAAYDLDGNRKWAKFVEKPTPPDTYGPSASPLLVGGKLIIHLTDLVALDPASGKELWRLKSVCYRGTPAVTAVGGGTLLVTPGGDVVDPVEGELLLKGIAKVEYCSPVVRGNIVYFMQNGGKAIRISRIDESFRIDTLWTAKLPAKRYYASPVFHNDLIYCVNEERVFSIVDAITGETVASQELNLGKKTVFASITMAGDVLFVSDESGATALLAPGREIKVLGGNQLEPFRASLVCQGGRLYVRGKDKLYCLGQK